MFPENHDSMPPRRAVPRKFDDLIGGSRLRPMDARILCFLLNKKIGKCIRETV